MRIVNQGTRVPKLIQSVSVIAVATLLSNAAFAQNALDDDLSAQGFSISMAGAEEPKPNKKNDREIDLQTVGVPARIQVKFEGINPVRTLGAKVQSKHNENHAGETVVFSTSANYPAFINRAEIRIFESTSRQNKLLEIVPAPVNGTVRWKPPIARKDALRYVLRVYDEKGRYDESYAHSVFEPETALKTTNVPSESKRDGTIRQRYIPLQGGVVTVFGTADAGEPVTVTNESVPASENGAFSVTRNLPAGTALVEVGYSSQGKRESLIRPIEIPASQWHYVGILDITAGHRIEDQQSSNTPDFERNYIDGRVAYYVSGKTQSGWSITSSADTGEGDIEEIFQQLDKKNPTSVLDRLSDDDLYPTYGDDSSSYDDTPTSGRVYLRAERGDTRALWGDFKTDVSSGGLLSNTRSLYGAEIRTALPARTQNGKSRLNVVTYAAQPETLPQTDILRGTGGSVYFLSRQDVNGQSETVIIEVVDPDTSRVIATKALQVGEDYQLDYLQGVITLSEPLSSASSVGNLIPSAGGDYDVNLVVQYEYTPTTGDIDGFSLGGRAEAWLTDQLRFGVTGMKESTGTADQKMVSTDLRFEFAPRSFIEAEVAQTEGPGFGRTVSSDGGLTLADEVAANGDQANAYRIDSQIDFVDLNLKQKGALDLYFERIEAGFTTLNKSITKDQVLIGGKLSVELSESSKLSAAAENFQEHRGDYKRSGKLVVSHEMSARWSVDAGIEYQNKKSIGDEDATGKRTDANGRLTYQPTETFKTWLLGQATVHQSGGLSRDDRVGAGAEWQISEKLTVAAELSDGTTGLGATSRLTYAPTKDQEIYVGYTLDPTRSLDGYDLHGRDNGKIVVGSKTKHSEKLSSYGETTFDLFGERYASTRTTGVTYKPTALWSVSGTVESGVVRDKHNGDIDRDAFSLGASYKEEKQFSSNARFEYRRDRGDDRDEEADTYAVKAGFGYSKNVNARLLGNLNALISGSRGDSIRDGEYVKGTLGYAIRPTLSEQFNLLFKYSYLHDLPGADQVTFNGSDEGDAQRSHVVSVDLDYDLTSSLTLGGKYGYRISEVAQRGTNDFDASSAHLGIARLNWHLVKNWDAMLEARVMYGVETETVATGALFGAYRHIGENLKLGVGYEWGQVSEDLTDLDYRNSGVFVNLIAKL
ncbi:hypothetical protein PsAD13_01979 [Pseudovibrio sp. Ad13]|uniref:hypothetical protein n=1 Tax=Pseudovibrio sp. Ad13 TaxID=989396 RepID=UPI0007B2415F|nr:hypothetical protein [Pseudovibrio sp. Ad13]KZK84515.1 hypothetical protein PsAD13_01979 [Pseudovibrio sp. Ad13]